MPDESIVSKESNGESKVFGVSVRGWLAIILVVTTCAMSFVGRQVIEPLYSMVLLSIGYYYGQKGK